MVFHAQIAHEAGLFAFADVVEAISAKLVRRHPNVFEDPIRRDECVGTDLWRRIKDEERAERGEGEAPSVLDDVLVGLPALTRAVKLQKRAAEVGFDWPSLAPVLAKAEEEIGASLKAAIDSGLPAKNVAEEFGDLLFVMANVARHLGLDPEAALREANAKFVRRFQSIETALAADGRKPQDSTLEEMDTLWDAAKAAEREG